MKKILLILVIALSIGCGKDDFEEIENCACGVVIEGSVGMNYGSGTFYPPITVKWNCTGIQEQIKVTRGYRVGEIYCR